MSVATAQRAWGRTRASGPAPTPPSARPRRLAPLVALALVPGLAGCGVGSGTLHIADAEAELVAAAAAVVAAVAPALGGGADADPPKDDAPVAAAAPAAGLREPCALPTGEAGLRSRVAVRIPGTATPAVLEAAAGALVAAGFLVVDPGVPDTLLGQRDGLSVALAEDAGTLELDGLTGCRPR